MTESGQPSDIAKITDLLTCYSFDLDPYTAGHLVEEWLSQYSIVWVRLAIIEALYQGRYKAISVQQILMLWKRRGQPIHHFNAEFERIVSSSIPRSLTPYEAPPAPPSITRRPSYDPQLRDRLEKLRSPMNRPPASPDPSPSVTPAVKASQNLQPPHTAETIVESPASELHAPEITPSLSSEPIAASFASPEIATDQEPQADPAIAACPEPANRLPENSPDGSDEPSLDGSMELSLDLAFAPLPVAEPSPGVPASPTAVSLVFQDLDSNTPSVMLPRSLPQPAQLGAMPIIEQFTPSLRTSGFYARLRAVVGDRPSSEDSSPEV